MNLQSFRVLGALLARARLGGAGSTFGGLRDVFEALGYKKDLDTSDYWLRYERNGVASRVVEAFPRGTWRGAYGELIEDPNPEIITPFETAWGELSDRLDVWPTMMQLDILAGLGRFAAMIIGAPGSLKTPLGENVTTEQIVYLMPYSERDVEVAEYEGDVSNPRFRQPTLYKFKRLDPNAATSSDKQTDVHWSRVHHVADHLLDDKVFGQPRLKRVWNLLDDLEKITGAGAEAFWLRAHQGYQFDVDKELKLDPQGEEDLDEEVDEFMHGLRRHFRSRGVKVTALGAEVATFDRNVDSVISQISAGTTIPQRILMGSERGQLASQQDRVNWSERVQDRRNEFAGPLVIRPFVKRLIACGALPEPKVYSVAWPRIFDLSDEERAKIAKDWAEINQKFGGTVVTENEIRDHILGLAPLPKDVLSVNEKIRLAKVINRAAPPPGSDGARPRPQLVG